VSRVFVAPVSFGLGDLVVSLPVIQQLIAQGRRTGDETWLVARCYSLSSAPHSGRHQNTG
jgi:hypothetical protein